MAQTKEKIRTVTFLTRREIDFLDKLGKDALFYLGKKLSRAYILEGLVDFLSSLDISIKDLNLKEDNFSEEILKIIHNRSQNTEDEKSEKEKSQV